MTTQTRRRNCALCNNPGAEHTPDGINYFCFEPSECLDRAQAALEKTDYQDATPEMYELFKIREAQAKTNWQKSIKYSQKLFTVLGLDNPEFLTFTDLENRIFFELSDNETGYTEQYSANPEQAAKELKELAQQVARFEAGQ